MKYYLVVERDTSVQNVFKIILELMGTFQSHKVFSKVKKKKKFSRIHQEFGICLNKWNIFKWRNRPSFIVLVIILLRQHRTISNKLSFLWYCLILKPQYLASSIQYCCSSKYGWPLLKDIYINTILKLKKFVIVCIIK